MEKKEKENKIPWGEGTPWKNSVAFYTYLRGCLRKAWSTNPIKITLLNSRRYQIPNPNPRGNRPTVWGFDCEMCGGTFPMREGQVDHVVPAGSLQRKEDIQGFVERLLFITKDDLRLVCKNCNSSLAYADKKGISFEDALAEKTAIKIVKEKKDRLWLEDRGVVPESTQVKRRKQIEDILKKGE
jgi:5-methylcytosine-specific restriction endonuclease McrA